MATEIVIVDETNIKGIINALKDLYRDIDEESNKMLEEIVSKGEKYLNKQYATRIKDPNIDDISTSWNKKGNEYELRASGKDVIYEEFGTGDEGVSHPHPNKSEYNLNDYNSGSYIRDVSSVEKGTYTYEDLQEIGITSGKFWQYEKNGTVYYTQGVPAGQEMWDTRNYLIKEVIPEVAKKRGKIINDKLKNSIKK